MRLYGSALTVSVNRKGVLDVDTVKGCTSGMLAYPGTGCYGGCYAAKTAALYGIDFTVAVSRRLFDWNRSPVWAMVQSHPADWYRIGTAGDPSHDWDNTLAVCEFLAPTGKVPVVITKHWRAATDSHLARLRAVRAVVNTSTSALDTEAETAHRMHQIHRFSGAGVISVNRVVTCEFGGSQWADQGRAKQARLLAIGPVIDNPLRVSRSHPRVISGDIVATRQPSAVGGGKTVSLHSRHVYLGTCPNCPDQCGVAYMPKETKPRQEQVAIFDDMASPHDVEEWIHVESVLGSGYEADVAKLAIEDKIAKRAARKNMQIHSAIILRINGEFAGFMTFQVNHVSREFCLLQSVIRPVHFTPARYEQLVREVIASNTHGYPAIITTDPKSKFETPKLFESLGFQTYLKMSGFHYMVHGKITDVRMKFLAHITMTNVWNSTKGDWLRAKAEWREQIEDAGRRHGVPNPAFATREGCWQGEQGMANVVTKDPTKPGKEEGRAHNGNASVLDPVACEVIARFFMPAGEGRRRIYNPFGGGVQMGYVAGGCGYEYLASEIRQNQCDANNLLCSDFPGVEWRQSDSATYDPPGEYDLVFSCPPYYKVERYVDYDGTPPPGEINSCPTYEEFRELLFSGYRRAIAKLRDNRFIVIMLGDSRDKTGAYHCAEAETELFLKAEGLAVYNKIVYLEAEFTRLAHAKKTLHVRKFPKREQKILVAYKGKPSDIKKHFAPVGRL